MTSPPHDSDRPDAPGRDGDPLGAARPLTPPPPARTTSPSRAAGGRRRAHPAKWGRRVAAGGASLAVVALTLHLGNGSVSTTSQASGTKGADATTARADDDSDGDEHSAALRTVGTSSSSTVGTSTSRSVAVTRSGGS